MQQALWDFTNVTSSNKTHNTGYSTKQNWRHITTRDMPLFFITISWY